MTEQTKTETRFIIDCSKEQANVINEALNIYQRILMGQFDNIPWMLFLHGRKFNTDAMRKTMDDAVKIAFPELYGGCYLGIYQKEVHEDARIAYDIHQALRYKISWNNNPSGGITRNFDSPRITSNTEPLPKIEIVEG